MNFHFHTIEICTYRYERSRTESGRFWLQPTKLRHSKLHFSTKVFRNLQLNVTFSSRINFLLIDQVKLIMPS